MFSVEKLETTVRRLTISWSIQISSYFSCTPWRGVIPPWEAVNCLMDFFRNLSGYCTIFSAHDSHLPLTSACVLPSPPLLYLSSFGPAESCDFLFLDAAFVLGQFFLQGSVEMRCCGPCKGTYHPKQISEGSDDSFVRIYSCTVDSIVSFSCWWRENGSWYFTS